MEPKNNLRERRRELRKRLEDIAEQLGVSVSQVSRWESGANAIPSTRLDDMARVYQLPIGEVHGDRAIGSPVRRIPLIGRIPAGNWREAIENPEGQVIAPDNVGPNVFALRPDGDSMNLIFPSDNGYLVIDPDDTDLIDGKIYAVMNDEHEATVKEFRVNPARLVPRSSNPEHHEIVIGKHGFTVIGRAVCKVEPM